jgi:hypothetical protein
MTSEPRSQPGSSPTTAASTSSATSVPLPHSASRAAWLGHDDGGAAARAAARATGRLPPGCVAAVAIVGACFEQNCEVVGIDLGLFHAGALEVALSH